MNNVEMLLDIAERHGVEVDEVHFRQLKACSVPGSVAIDRTKYQSEAEFVVDLAHELGHVLTDSFYSTSTPDITKQDCEDMANRWAMMKLMPGVKGEVEQGNDTPAGLALRYGVTREFAETALKLLGVK